MKTYDEMAESVFDRIDYYQSTKKKKKYCMRIIICSCSLVLGLILALNIWNPTFAKELPLVGGAFEFIQNKLTYAGLYSNYAYNIGETSSNNGIDITLAELYCDGSYLYTSFIVDGIDFSRDLKNKNYSQFQLNYYGENYVIFENNRIELTESGFWAGLEGEYIDEDTFVGEAILYPEGDTQFPDSFTLVMNIDSIGIIGDDQKMVFGTWKFRVDTLVNKKDVITYDIGVERNGYRIDQVVVSPIMVSIFTSYPDINYESDRLKILTYGDDHSAPCSGNGVLYSTEAVNRIPRNDFGDYINIYMVDYGQQKVLNPRAEDTVKQHAIVSYHLVLE